MLKNLRPKVAPVHICSEGHWKLSVTSQNVPQLAESYLIDILNNHWIYGRTLQDIGCGSTLNLTLLLFVNTWTVKTPWAKLSDWLSHNLNELCFWFWNSKLGCPTWLYIAKIVQPAFSPWCLWGRGGRRAGGDLTHSSSDFLTGLSLSSHVIACPGLLNSYFLPILSEYAL